MLAASAQGQQRLTAQAVDDAIERGTQWLWQQRNASGHWEGSANNLDRYWAGDSALAALALLYAGEDPRSDRMRAVLEWLAGQEIRATYVYALRAHALALARGQHRKRLQEDCDWLATAMYPRGWPNDGMYGYLGAKAEGRGGWADYSNSQFGVLGMWMATEAGASLRRVESYWQTVEARWLAGQNSDGGWSYQNDQQSTGSMTAAGLATLYVVLDRNHGASGHRGARKLLTAIDDGMDWFGRNFSAENPSGSGQWLYYYLYGLERTGRASGRKYFRDQDWFQAGGRFLLEQQQPAGNWPGGGMSALQNSAFALMFLCHGRAPVLFNKLEHADDWDVYLRDASGLSRYGEKTFERLLSWQIVDLGGPIEDLLESPVLYLCGRSDWRFDDAQLFKLREYVTRGGLIFANVPENGAAFQGAMRRLAAELFPSRPLQALPKDHPLINGQAHFRIDQAPELLHVSNGLRVLFILSPTDLARSWNTGNVQRGARDFQLGANVYLLATDKTTPRNRLETTEIPLRSVEHARTIRLTRVQYDGDWDVESYGWTRMQAALNNDAATRLVTTSGVSLPALAAGGERVAYISGTAEFELSRDEIAALSRFLTSGGTLLADAAGGSRGFTESLEKHVRAALQLEPVQVPPGSFLITGQGLAGGIDTMPVRYRRGARVDQTRDSPTLRAFDTGRRLAVIYSPLDLSGGLLGSQIFGCNGYAPETAMRIARNMLMYANLSVAEQVALCGQAGGPPK